MTQISAGLRGALAGRLGDDIAGALLSVLDTLGGDGSGDFTTVTVGSTIAVDADSSEATNSITIGNASGNQYVQVLTITATNVAGILFHGTGGASLQYTAEVTAKNLIDFPANLADAFSLRDGTNRYLTCTSTTGGLFTRLGSSAVGAVANYVEYTADATTSETVTPSDSGRVYVQLDQDEAVTYTLPATQNGLIYTFVCGHAGGEINISPNANDKITGKGIAGSDDQDIKNTNASNAVGDSITLVGDGVDGWLVIAIQGTWATV